MSQTESYFVPVETPELPELDEHYLPEQVRVHFEFGMHEYAEHFDDAAERIDETDIYIPECRGWSERELTIHQRLAKASGENHAKIMRQVGLKPGTFYYARAQSVQSRTGKSNLVMRLIDITAEEQAAVDQELAPHMREGIVRGASQNFETAVQLYYEAQVGLVNDVQRRRKIMIENLGPTVTQAVTEIPFLAKKEEVKTLVTLGSAHTGVYDYLAASPYTQEQVSMHKDVGVLQDESIAFVMDTLEPKMHAGEPVSREEALTLTLTLCLTDDVVKGLVQFPTRHNLPAIHFKNHLFRLLTRDIDDGTTEMIFRLWGGHGSPADQQRLDGYVQQAQELARDIPTAALVPVP